jgi:hypothetical protein
MPTISSFYGIMIRMFFNDHDPPPIHARYGEFEATIEIESRRVLKGELPVRALSLVSEWTAPHKAELDNWRLCREKISPVKVNPLP